MGAPVTLVSAGNQANPAGAPYSASNPLPVASYSSSGTENTALPPGRAAQTASVPVVLSNEDYARISQTYRRSATVSATAGDAVFVTGVTTAGTVTFTLANGGSLSVSVPLGTSVFPFSVTAAALGTAVGGTFQSLFFT
jgi:hypothetical protein